MLRGTIYASFFKVSHKMFLMKTVILGYYILLYFREWAQMHISQLNIVLKRLMIWSTLSLDSLNINKITLFFVNKSH